MTIISFHHIGEVHPELNEVQAVGVEVLPGPGVVFLGEGVQEEEGGAIVAEGA